MDHIADPKSGQAPRTAKREAKGTVGRFQEIPWDPGDISPELERYLTARTTSLYFVAIPKKLKPTSKRQHRAPREIAVATPAIFRSRWSQPER